MHLPSPPASEPTAAGFRPSGPSLTATRHRPTGSAHKLWLVRHAHARPRRGATNRSIPRGAVRARPAADGDPRAGGSGSLSFPVRLDEGEAQDSYYVRSCRFGYLVRRASARQRKVEAAFVPARHSPPGAGIGRWRSLGTWIFLVFAVSSGVEYLSSTSLS